MEHLKNSMSAAAEINLDLRRSLTAWAGQERRSHNCFQRLGKDHDFGATAWLIHLPANMDCDGTERQQMLDAIVIYPNLYVNPIAAAFFSHSQIKPWCVFCIAKVPVPIFYCRFSVSIPIPNQWYRQPTHHYSTYFTEYKESSHPVL